MSIFEQIKRLIKGSPDAQAATQHMITVLAAEAVKTGNPDALVAVAAQWEQLQEGRMLPPGSEHANSGHTFDFTTAAELKPLVIKVMQNAYIGGITEVTNGMIKKQINTYKLANGGWKDADLQDNDPARHPTVVVEHPEPSAVRTAPVRRHQQRLPRMADVHPGPAAPADVARSC